MEARYILLGALYPPDNLLVFQPSRIQISWKSLIKGTKFILGSYPLLNKTFLGVGIWISMIE